MSKVKLYTTHCPKCNVLKAKLDDKNLQYEEVTDSDVMTSLGIDEVPVLQIDDGPLMVFSEAVKYVNQMEACQ